MWCKVFFSLLALFSNAVFARNVSIVCRSHDGYFDESDSNPDCWYDPDINASPEKLAENYQLSLERHFVSTKDDWNLTIFRLKTSKGYGNGVVFLQHGMMADAMCFMVNGNNSIAFFLAKRGYDVWLGNFRGSEFSEHVTLKRSDNAVWNFSFHEHGLYDLPAYFEYVTGQTQSKILYVGHSMGGTVMAIYLSSKPLEAKTYIQHSVLLESPTFMRHTKGFLTLSVVSNLYEVLGILPQININVLMTTSSFERQSLLKYCFTSLADLKNCMEIAYSIFGHSKYPIPPEKIFMAISSLRNCAFKVMYHYLQIIRSGEFCMYDYGPEENRNRYNSSVPPNYNLSYLPNDITWIYGATDALVTKKDIRETFKRFQKPGWQIFEIPYNHINFLIDNIHIADTFLPLLTKIVKKHIY